MKIADQNISTGMLRQNILEKQMKLFQEIKQLKNSQKR